MEDIDIKEDIARDYITIYTSKRKPDYKPINLLSCYSKRYRERTRLSPLFIEIFLKEEEKYKLKKKIDIKERKLDMKIISDWKSENIDVLAGKHLIADKAITASLEDMQKIFDYFVRRSLTPFYPEDRSVGRVKESIYKFFEQELKMDYGEKGDEIIQIVLSDNNIRHFIIVINITKDVYKKETDKEEPEAYFVENWNVPDSLSFGSRCLKEDRGRCVMHPFFSDGRWKTEKAFIEYLEKSDKIKWWFKNGDRDATFFAVPYEEDGIFKPFYVDFIVMLKDGKIGLFDTKSGITAKVAGPKSDGLVKYIKEENKKGRKLFGGIVTQRGGSWLYWAEGGYYYKENDFKDWEILDLS